MSRLQDVTRNVSLCLLDLNMLARSVTPAGSFQRRLAARCDSQRLRVVPVRRLKT